MSEQRDTFDQVAGLYDRVRPTAPAEALEALWRGLEVAPGARVLEVGCGTGQLTLDLLGRGAHVHAIEPGAALAEVIQQKTAGQPFTLEVASFESAAIEHEAFEAVAASQAAHWVPRDAFLDQTARAIGVGRHLALLWHLDISQDTDFYRATQPLYDRHLPDADTRPPRTLPDHLAAYEAALEADTRFARAPTARWPWTRTFDTEGYLRMLQTHSPVRMLDEAARSAFLAGHHEVLESFGGEIDRFYETVLVLATRVA